MQQWELKRVWIPYDVVYEREEGGKDWWRTAPSSGTERAWGEAQQMASEGWELVAAVPGAIGAMMKAISEHGGWSPTDGYWLLFKRPLAGK